MSAGFSVVLLAESPQKHEQLAQVLSRSCRDFTQVHDVEGLIRLAQEKPISVLLFGFATIEQNEVAYFRMLKMAPEVEQRIQSNMLLCARTEIKHAFQLCRKGLFNDYYIAQPLYDPYHLLLRFRQLKSLQESDQGMAAISPNSISAVCDSLERIAQGDAQVSGINAELLQQLGETIGRAMDSLGRMIEQQLGEGGSNLQATRELISRHSRELVDQPIRDDVGEAVRKVKEVTAEMSELAVEQRVLIGQDHPELAPRRKRVIVVEDNAQSMEELTAALHLNACETICFNYGTDFVRVIDTLGADIVMLDLTLPDMPAIHLVQKIKQSPTLSHAKLFVMAQQGDREKVELVMGMGVDEVIIKPIDEQMMAFKLKHY